MRSECESAHSPQNIGPGGDFQKLMRNRCAVVATDAVTLDLLQELTALSSKAGANGPIPPLLVAPRGAARETVDAINAMSSVKRKLADLGGIPVWENGKWVDRRLIAAGGLPISAEGARLLALMNYWDRNSDGALSDADHPEGYVTLGRAESEVPKLRQQLAKLGYSVVIDQKLRMWRLEVKK